MSPDGNPTVHACVVSWNVRGPLWSCLASLERQEGVDLHITVVDNDSHDGSAEMVREEFPEVTLLEPGENLGFARGANLGFEGSTAEFLMLLNPDTRLKRNAFIGLVGTIKEDHQNGVVAPRLVYEDGTIQPSARRFPTFGSELSHYTGLDVLWRANPWRSRYMMLDFPHDRRMEVDQPMGAALLIRRSVWEEVGGMDGEFPLYFEDVDICYRVKRAGWRIVFDPGSEVVHLAHASTKQSRKRAVEMRRLGMLRFAKKHGLARPGGLGLLRAVSWVQVRLRQALDEDRMPFKVW